MKTLALGTVAAFYFFSSAMAMYGHDIPWWMAGMVMMQQPPWRMSPRMTMATAPELRQQRLQVLRHVRVLEEQGHEEEERRVASEQRGEAGGGIQLPQSRQRSAPR